MVSLSVASRSRRSRIGARAGAILLGVLVAVAAWAGLAGGLLAWAALGVTERVFRQGRKIWLVVVGAGLVVSFSGTPSGAGVSIDDRLALALLHLVVAGVIIPLLYQTTNRSQANRLEGQH